MAYFNTKAIRGQMPRTAYKEHSTPLFLTSSFVFDDAEAMRAAFAEEQEALIYSRYSNPNTDEFIHKMCLLEEAEAGMAMASGMAAVFSSMAALLQSGEHLLSCASIFGATHAVFTKYFPKWGISHSYFDLKNPQSLEALIRPGQTKLIYVETPTNPAIEVLDLEWLGAFAKAHNLLLLVDNCFATPYIQQPRRYGADLVIHSATKFIDGQGRVLGGVVVGREDLVDEIYRFARITGPSLSPFNAWVLSKSLETLGLRMERHSANALGLAQALEGHPALNLVNYPFLPSHPQYDIAKKQMKLGGGILTFNLKGGSSAGQRFMDALQMIRISPNLGDSRSIATHPASSTHCKLSPEERLAVGITDGLIRLSVGLEDLEDIQADVFQALEKAL